MYTAIQEQLASTLRKEQYSLGYFNVPACIETQRRTSQFKKEF